MKKLRRPLALATGLVILVAGAGLATGASTSSGQGSGTKTRSLRDALLASQQAEQRWVDPTSVHRSTVPTDRYELAGGCYVARAFGTGHYVVRAGEGFAATGTSASTAEPFHLQAYDLGKYLLYASQSDFLALPVALRTTTHGVIDTGLGYVRGTSDETLNPVRAPILKAGAAADDTTGPLSEAVQGGRIVAAAAPSEAAEWVVKAAPGSGFVLRAPIGDGDPSDPGPLEPNIAGTLQTSTNGFLALGAADASGNATRFRFEVAEGCAKWPEIGTQVTGPQPHGSNTYQEVSGYVDAHLHGMAFEFLGGKVRCGRPWHPYGVVYALVDCPDHGPGGHGAALESLLSGTNPAQGHDTVGWPTFGYWPHYNSLTHEQVYYTWLERAWRGGLRMYTNLLVDNGVLCEVYPLKKNSCNEMDGVRLQAKRIHQLERYIDAQSGGPGKGWFRLVTDPFQARRIVNAGKLAVVMGIEVSVPFDCGEYLGQARCTQSQIDARLDEVYGLGVRQMELTNKFDNALTGVTGDSGTTGPVVNNGNRLETGHYWEMQQCKDQTAKTTDQRYDNTQLNVGDNAGLPVRDSIFAGVLDIAGGSGAAPVYPAGPQCNVIGLSDLGKHAIAGLASRGMIFDPDHMSAIARKQSIDYVKKLHYSGVVSSHSWADDPTYASIVKLGGMVTPHAGSAEGFVKKWRQLRAWSDPRYVFGMSYGSDINGFSAQGAPRKPAKGKGVTYPFTGLGGVVVNKQVSGVKTYDFNTSGVDHYGLYPDWVEDGRIIAGKDGAAFMADMSRGAEAYLQTWERAIGIAPDACRPDVPNLSNGSISKVKRGMSPEQVLAAIGQPKSRIGSAFTYCGSSRSVTVTFGSNRQVATVA